MYYAKHNPQQVVYTHHFPQSGTVCSAMAELSSSICLGGRPLNMDTQSLAGDAGEVTLGCQTGKWEIPELQ